MLVDAVVTDKKQHYIEDLQAKDFHVYDNDEEQKISSFTHGSGPAGPNGPGGGNRRYVVLFFDNSTMSIGDQALARKAAAQFIDKTTSGDRVMAVIEFTGTFHLVQNFTDNADLLARAVKTIKTSAVNPNAPPDALAATASLAAPPVTSTVGGYSLTSMEADFGAQNLLYALRDVSKMLAPIPGRKSLILFSAGFPLNDEYLPELTAAIDAANKANVAIYPLDVRGVFTGAPDITAPSPSPTGLGIPPGSAELTGPGFPHYEGLLAFLWPQHSGGGGGGGGHAGGGGGAPGGGTGGGGTGGGGTGGGHGGSGDTGGGHGGSGGTGGGRGGGGGGGAGTATSYNTLYNNPNFQPNANIPQFPPSASTNQQVLYALANGTGGFPIFNTNDFAGGLDKIAHELDEYYVLGYAPAELTHDGSYHRIQVKVESKGLEVRARNGYYDTKGADVLASKPEGKTLEAMLRSPQAGSASMSAEASYFYTAANQARVNLALSVPGDALQFEKQKKSYHCDVSVLGIAYAPDGAVAARFSDTRSLDFEKKELKDFSQNPFIYRSVFDVAPGTYNLKIVLGTGGDSFAKQEVPLKVQPYDGKQFAVSDVMLSNSVHPVSQATVDLDEALLQDQKSFVAQGMQLVPSADNHFKLGQTVGLYVEVYEPLMVSGATPQVGLLYEVIDRNTNQAVLSSGGAVPVNGFARAGNPVIPVGLPLKLEGLSAGTYEVELRARDTAGNSSPVHKAEFVLN